jgi:hypothetical protein
VGRMGNFGPGAIRDLATFEQPNLISVGMDCVLFNSAPAIANGKLTGALPGKVVRGTDFRPLMATSADGRGEPQLLRAR